MQETVADISIISYLMRLYQFFRLYRLWSEFILRHIFIWWDWRKSWKDRSGCL